MTLPTSTSNPGRPFVHIEAYRKGGAPIQSAQNQLYFQSGLTETDSLTGFDSWSAQQNVWGGRFDPATGKALDPACHWYQNTIVVASGQASWHLQGFTIPQGQMADPNANGEFYISFNLPAKVNLPGGDDVCLFVTEDTGSAIRSRLLILRQSTSAWLYDSCADPNVKGQQYNGSPLVDDGGYVIFDSHWSTLPSWRSPLNAFEIGLLGFGYGSKATFQQGSFFAKAVAEPQAKDLTWGGTWWNADGTPGSDNLSELVGGGGTAETGNVQWSVQDPNPYELLMQGVLT